MKKLFLIPARGGSKGLLRKNILPLAGRPMIYYSIDAAKGAFEEGDEICVSTDDIEIKQVVEKYGVEVPFMRPPELASDTANSEVVVQHALEWYERNGRTFDLIILLQVTSPLRNSEHIKEALVLSGKDVDMVVSAKETDANPYYNLFEESHQGYLLKSKIGEFDRRQDCPKVYELNGAIYIISVNKFRALGIKNMNRIVKYLMSKTESIDIDDIIDFELAEMFINKKNDE